LLRLAGVEEIKFGEVADRPPIFTARPRIKQKQTA
jgi:hypothetical protein